MNVYDFDNTVFSPDSSYCFVLFCLRKHPRAVLRSLPGSIWPLFRFLCEGKKDAQKLKESLFSFLNKIDSAETAAGEFWDRHYEGIESWYLAQKSPDDIIVSASPEFLLRPAAERLGVRLIATPMNPYTGKIKGKNCHDVEKVRRFREAFPDTHIDAFYSDSLSDAPMAAIADKAFLVKNHQIGPWPEQN